jgi:hypothetical protein
MKGCGDKIVTISSKKCLLFGCQQVVTTNEAYLYIAFLISSILLNGCGGLRYSARNL